MGLQDLSFKVIRIQRAMLMKRIKGFLKIPMAKARLTMRMQLKSTFKIMMMKMSLKLMKVKVRV